MSKCPRANQKPYMCDEFISKNIIFVLSNTISIGCNIENSSLINKLMPKIPSNNFTHSLILMFCVRKFYIVGYLVAGDQTSHYLMFTDIVEWVMNRILTGKYLFNTLIYILTRRFREFYWIFLEFWWTLIVLGASARYFETFGLDFQVFLFFLFSVTVQNWFYEFYGLKVVFYIEFS